MIEIINTIKDLASKIPILGEEITEEKKEGFLNNLDFNQTCLLITLLFVIIFMYKKEIMKMLNLK